MKSTSYILSWITVASYCVLLKQGRIFQSSVFPEKIFAYFLFLSWNIHQKFADFQGFFEKYICVLKTIPDDLWFLIAQRVASLNGDGNARMNIGSELLRKCSVMHSIDTEFLNNISFNLREFLMNRGMKSSQFLTNIWINFLQFLTNASINLLKINFPQFLFKVLTDFL